MIAKPGQFKGLDQETIDFIKTGKATYPNKPSNVPPYVYPTWVFDNAYILPDNRIIAVYFDGNFGWTRKYLILNKEME